MGAEISGCSGHCCGQGRSFDGGELNGRLEPSHASHDSKAPPPPLPPCSAYSLGGQDELQDLDPCCDPPPKLPVGFVERPEEPLELLEAEAGRSSRHAPSEAQPEAGQTVAPASPCIKVTAAAGADGGAITVANGSRGGSMFGSSDGQALRGSVGAPGGGVGSGGAAAAAGRRTLGIVSSISTRPSANSADSSGSRQSKSSLMSKAPRASVFQFAPGASSPLAAERLDQDALERFRRLLERDGVDTSSWGLRGSKAIDQLYWEVYHQKRAIIFKSGPAGRLNRASRLVKIRLIADIDGVDHILQSRMQFMRGGQMIERRQVPLRKLEWLKVAELSEMEGLAREDARPVWDDALLREEQCPYSEDALDGAGEALEERLGLLAEWRSQHLEEVPGEGSFHVEDNVPSYGYVGLNTLYCVHTVTFRVVNPADIAVRCIGLPGGQDFVTQEGSFLSGTRSSEDLGRKLGARLNIWTWIELESSPHLADGAGAAIEAAEAAASAAEAMAQAESLSPEGVSAAAASARASAYAAASAAALAAETRTSMVAGEKKASKLDSSRESDVDGGFVLSTPTFGGNKKAMDAADSASASGTRAAWWALRLPKLGGMSKASSSGSTLSLPTQRNSMRSDPSTPLVNSKRSSQASLFSGPEATRIMRTKVRVPLLETSARKLAGSHGRITQWSQDARIWAPSPALRAALEGERTDWEKARRIAKRILDPAYTLKMYFEDLSAFPEVTLYLLDETEHTVSGVVSSNQSTSGRTMGDEYQRTIGAFFAIYWLFRLNIDGKDGFTFGVDNSWSIFKPKSVEDSSMAQAAKRILFKEQADWSYIEGLLTDAGLLIEERKNFLHRAARSHTTGVMKVCEKRLVSLLALTAVHDIMKVTCLIPEVQPQHAPYHGYAAGDKIADHDHALSYIMDHYPEILPSFRDLDPEERKALQFTQCRLCFNHGWFVQGEAPPGAIFSTFREALVCNSKSQIGPREVALYFVHWLTDLAGAEPSPLAGCEKFAVKFPLPVLNSFLRSFEFVEKISMYTETEVNEEYLRARWADDRALGSAPPPSGPDGVAKMRVLCMAQGAAQCILRAWPQLTDEDQEVLSTEMARTGCRAQSYSTEVVPADVVMVSAGPAFLIYYGPAFLQTTESAESDIEPLRRLRLLAEIYRCARRLWPLSAEKDSTNVTVRIDAIKALSTREILDATQEGGSWIMVKHNELEAFIELVCHRRLNELISNKQTLQILDAESCCTDHEPME